MKQDSVQLQNDIKIVCILKLFFYKKHFFSLFFSSFNLNRGYGNQRRLFSVNLSGMFYYCAKVSYQVVRGMDR